MTDLDQTKGMLDRGGWKYTCKIVKDYCLQKTIYRPKRITKKLVTHQPLTLLDIEGPFYDSLHMVFSEEGQLVHMNSHVAYNDPACTIADTIFKEVSIGTNKRPGADSSRGV